MVGFTFDYYVAHPELVRLVMNENVLNGTYLSRSTAIQRLNVIVIDAMRGFLDRGRRDGAFRSDLDPVERT